MCYCFQPEEFGGTQLLFTLEWENVGLLLGGMKILLIKEFNDPTGLW